MRLGLRHLLASSVLEQLREILADQGEQIGVLPDVFGATIDKCPALLLRLQHFDRTITGEDHGNCSTLETLVVKLCQDAVVGLEVLLQLLVNRLPIRFDINQQNEFTRLAINRSPVCFDLGGERLEIHLLERSFRGQLGPIMTDQKFAVH